jgi:murein peptide amidase A
MNAVIKDQASQSLRRSPERSLPGILDPLDATAITSPNLVTNRAERFQITDGTLQLPRFTFIGPRGGDEPIRIGLFAGIHGDEPEGVFALIQFLRLLDAKPELATGYCLFIYPVCNPTGFEANTRHSNSGKDLNREFWTGSRQPEVRFLEAELAANAFHGIISLHTDDTSHGFYGFAHGATLTENLIEPALTAAEQFLRRNREAVIDGFNANEGVIREGYHGVLSAPPEARPRPYEIILETPKAAPHTLKEAAFVAALQSILASYRELVAYAPNL